MNYDTSAIGTLKSQTQLQFNDWSKTNICVKLCKCNNAGRSLILLTFPLVALRKQQSIITAASFNSQQPNSTGAIPHRQPRPRSPHKC